MIKAEARNKMITLEQAIKAEGKAEGIQEGEAKGIQLGEAVGLQRGRLIGMIESYQRVLRLPAIADPIELSSLSNEELAEMVESLEMQISQINR